MLIGLFMLISPFMSSLPLERIVASVSSELVER
jgi:hypothetical protein